MVFWWFLKDPPIDKNGIQRGHVVIPPSSKMHQGPARTFKPQKRKSSGLCRSRWKEVLEDHSYGGFKGVEPLKYFRT